MPMTDSLFVKTFVIVVTLQNALADVVVFMQEFKVFVGSANASQYVLTEIIISCQIIRVLCM